MQNRPRVAVVGGGTAGITAALSLARRNVEVALVERDSELGGNALTVCCKAVDGKCQLCGACLLFDQLTALRDSDGSTQLLTGSTVAWVDRSGDRFQLSLSLPTGSSSLETDAVILATGFDHIDAHTKGPYGYGILPQVTTGHDVEKQLRENGQSAYDGMALEKIAFIQCVGSRDEHCGRGYCSQVCCRYALRLARVFRSRVPDVQISIFKMDIQASGRDFAETWAAVADEDIRLVAALPAVIRRSTDRPDRVTFTYDELSAGEVRREDFDLVVLSVGMQPRRDAARVADMFGINQDAYGFFAAGGDGASTIVPGVFVAGSCQAPRSIAESIVHAEQAAETCYRYLQEKRS